MKTILTILLLTASFLSFSQTAKEYLDRGIEKHNKQDYKGALKEYDKAIKADNNFTAAYYNRGTVKLALSDLKGSLADFDKTISLDSTFVKAWYSRATVYVSMEKYKEGISDLDKVIKRDEKFPNALTLRGQLHAALGDKNACCKDFQRAKEMGDPSAAKYLEKYCGNEQQKGESLMLHWPEAENWKMASNQEDDKMTMIELVRNNETLENWTEIGTMQALKGITGVPMDKAMNLMFEEAKKNCPKAKLTFIEKDEGVEHPWTIFTIECSSFEGSKDESESQLWYVVQGKTSLYINFRAVRQPSVPEETKKKWIEFFKGGKVVYLEDK